MSKSRLMGFGIVLLGLLSAENVVAQAAPQSDISAQSRSGLTPAQMQKRASDHLKYMYGLKETIEKKLKKAKSKNDIALGIALNDKLTEISAAISEAEKREKSIVDAIAIGDTDRISQALTVMSVLAEKARIIEQDVARLAENGDYEGGLGKTDPDASEKQPVTPSPNMPGGGGGGIIPPTFPVPDPASPS